MNVMERVADGEPLEASVESWLAQFERALAAGDDVALHDLFLPESHWRDILALTWSIETVSGSGAVAEAVAATRSMKPSGFMLDRARTAPRVTTRAGTQSTEAFFKFETAIGRCNGILRLIGGKAWTLMTALELSPLVLALVIVGVPLIVNCEGTTIETELMLDDDCLGDVFLTVTVNACVVPVLTVPGDTVVM